MKNFKFKVLNYATKFMLATSLFFILPACFSGSYQPQVPEHLQDHE